MNKPILMPQLSATRARTGMRTIGELMALLIKQYELQDQLRAKQQAATATRRSAAAPPATRASTRSSTSESAPTASASRRSSSSRGPASKQSASNQMASKGATVEFSNSRLAQGMTTTQGTTETQRSAKAVQATFAWFDAPSTEPVGV